MPIFIKYEFIFLKSVGWLGIKAHAYNLVRVAVWAKHIAKTLSQTLQHINPNGSPNLLLFLPFLLQFEARSQNHYTIEVA